MSCLELKSKRLDSRAVAVVSHDLRLDLDSESPDFMWLEIGRRYLAYRGRHKDVAIDSRTPHEYRISNS